MKKLAFLEYAYIFDPSSTWSNIHDFENKLGKFFAREGYDANIIDYVGESNGKRIIFLTKIESNLDKPIGKPPIEFKNQKTVKL